MTSLLIQPISRRPNPYFITAERDRKRKKLKDRKRKRSAKMQRESESGGQ